MPGNAGLLQPENKPAFRGVVGRHLHADLVAGDKTDEPFAHLARNVGQNLVLAGDSRGQLPIKIRIDVGEDIEF